MLTTALPLLPPPATSLLPDLNDYRNPDVSSQHDGQRSVQAHQAQQRRAQGHPYAMQPRSQLAMLAHDERVIAQRKLAIQMYGYSWLKPAGCSKTMLGRREEEIEREEVEKQLREAEIQERTHAEMEEAQRQAQLDEQRTRELNGEVVGQGERDLDEDVPDADNTGIFDEDESGEEDEDFGAEDEEVDLDADIPEGNSGLAYDTIGISDSDTQSVSNASTSSASRARNRPPAPVPPARNRQGDPVRRSPLREEYDAEADLDDEPLDMDIEGQDLDDEVPDADQEDDGWEHTDTELDESDMDISIMPPGVMAHNISVPPRVPVSTRRSPRHNRQSLASQTSEAGSSMRRTSGNIPQPMLPPARPVISGRGVSLANQLTPNFAPGQLGSDFSVSALISTGNTDMSSESMEQIQRDWLDPAGARRNLFGARGPAQSIPISSNRIPATSRPEQNSGSSSNQGIRQVSSGGLFTPSPQQQNAQRQPPGATQAEPQSRTRSGRVIGRFRGGTT